MNIGGDVGASLYVGIKLKMTLEKFGHHFMELIFQKIQDNMINLALDSSAIKNLSTVQQIIMVELLDSNLEKMQLKMLII